MKTPPPNAQLRSYTEFDFDDNPPFKGELTTMFGQLAMCVSPHAGYGASDRILWAVVGEHMRFTTRENAHGYQYGLCLEVDPEAQTVTMDWYASERDYEERKVDSQKTMHINEFGRFDVLFDKYIYDMTSLGVEWHSKLSHFEENLHPNLSHLNAQILKNFSIKFGVYKDVWGQR